MLISKEVLGCDSLGFQCVSPPVWCWGSNVFDTLAQLFVPVTSHVELPCPSFCQCIFTFFVLMFTFLRFVTGLLSFNVLLRLRLIILHPTAAQVTGN